VKYLGSILCFAMAAIGAYLGATGHNFYGGGVGRLATKNPIPKWFGRLWFICCALALFYMGIKSWP
jgi:hypothetical protein